MSEVRRTVVVKLDMDDSDATRLPTDRVGQNGSPPTSSALYGGEGDFGVSIATRIVAGIFLRDPSAVLFYVGAVTLFSTPFAYYLVFRADYAIFQEDT